MANSFKTFYLHKICLSTAGHTHTDYKTFYLYRTYCSYT